MHIKQHQAIHKAYYHKCTVANYSIRKKTTLCLDTWASQVVSSIPLFLLIHIVFPLKDYLLFCMLCILALYIDPFSPRQLSCCKCEERLNLALKWLYYEPQHFEIIKLIFSQIEVRVWINCVVLQSKLPFSDNCFKLNYCDFLLYLFIYSNANYRKIFNTKFSKFDSKKLCKSL